MVWRCMLWDGPGYACKVNQKMDGDNYVKILEEDLQASLNYYGYSVKDIIFQQDNLTMTPSIPAKRPKPGLKTMISRF